MSEASEQEAPPNPPHDHVPLETVDVAIFGIAIRTSLWLGLHKHLASTNDCSFKIFFCGPNRPPFPLPKNLVYIHSEMKPAACAEIARRLALAEGAEYTMDMPDDFVADPHLLDTLIKEMGEIEGEAVVAPGFKPSLSKGVINLSSDPSLIGRSGEVINLAMMKCSTAQKMGGIDKRFEGSYFAYDQLMRLEAHENITFKVCSNVSVAEDDSNSVQRRNVPGGTRLSVRYTAADRPLLISLWDHTPVAGLRRGQFKMPKFDYPPRRKDDVQLYDEADLTYTVYTSEGGDVTPAKMPLPSPSPSPSPPLPHTFTTPFQHARAQTPAEELLEQRDAARRKARRS